MAWLLHGFSGADLLTCSWLRMVFKGAIIPTANRFLPTKIMHPRKRIFSVNTKQQTSIPFPCQGAPFNTCSKRKFNASHNSRGSNSWCLEVMGINNPTGYPSENERMSHEKRLALGSKQSLSEMIGNPPKKLLASWEKPEALHPLNQAGLAGLPKWFQYLITERVPCRIEWVSYSYTSPMTVPLSVPISALTPIPIPLRIGISAYLYLIPFLIPNPRGVVPFGYGMVSHWPVPNLKDDEALLSKGHRIDFHRRQWLHVRHEEGWM